MVLIERIFDQKDGDEEFSREKKITLLALIVIVDFLFILLLVFAFINIYQVLYKQKKYLMILMVSFYSIAIINILALLCQVSTQLIESYCNIAAVVSQYIHYFFNLALGLC